MSRRIQRAIAIAAPTNCRAGSSRGFTLIEVMIVITLIMIIATIALPNLIRSRMHVNEGAAVANLRTITSGEQQYQSAAVLPFPSGMGQYGTLAQLAAPVPPFVDNVLGSGAKEGYNFTAAPGGVDGAPTFTTNADPILFGSTGSRAFFANESGVITWASPGPAGPADLPVQ